MGNKSSLFKDRTSAMGRKSADHRPADEEEQELENSVVEEGAVDPQVKARFADRCFFRRYLTTEPTMMLYFATFLPLIPLTQQFVLHQVRQNMNLVDTEVNASACLVNTSSELYILDNKAQSQASQWMILFNMVLFIPGFFSTIMIGSYSDHKGRKVGLATPLVGGTLRCVLSCWVTAFGLRLEWMVIGLVLEGFSGGPACFIMAGFSYIADVTNHAQRSARIFLLEVGLGVGTVAGQISVGYLIKSLGFSYCFLLYAGFHAINLASMLLWVIETRAGGGASGTSEKGPLGLCSTKHFVKVYRLFFTDTVDSRRWKLQLSLVLLFLSCLIELGSGDNITYFQIHQPLCFTPIMIGFWQAGNYTVRNLFGGLMVKFMHKHLGDTGLMVLSFLSGITFYLLVAFTTSVLMMYIVTLGSLFFSLLTPMVRSFASKLCSKDEQGAIFVGITMTQTLAMVVGDITFNSIYAATVHTIKGLVFVIQAAILGIGLILTTVLIGCIRRDSKKYLRLVHTVDVVSTDRSY